MKILGIHSLTHDSGVCLYKNGKVAYALEEERLSRIKHHPGIEVEGKPPLLSLSWTLKEANLQLKEIDKFVHVGWKGDKFMKLDLARNRFRDFAKSLDPDTTRTSFVPHHKAHAASAYYASGFDDALVLVVDGAGDWTSTSLYIGEGRELRKVDEYPPDQSLGFLYSKAAKIIGLGDFGFGEGKMTALAAYGTQIHGFPQIIKTNDGKYTIEQDYFDHFMKYKKENGELTQTQKDFAFMVQTALENAIIDILNFAHNKYGKTKIAFSGGVALNCRLNGKISALPWVDDFFIQAGANDCGLCLGAAYLGAVESGEPITKMSDSYLGPDIKDDDVGSFVKSNKLRAKKLNDVAKACAELISEGKIVGFMHGRLEFGPRALGHRSLLGDPRNIEVRDKLNIIKQREPWRPVAPAIVDSEKQYCQLSKATEFMTKALPMNELAIKEIPAALHVDNTARVQVVRNKDDLFYTVIREFENITSIPAILNTSLNSKGEPLCASIEDGVKFFFTTPTDYLIIDKWLIEK